jgi:hypothetical protein
MKLAQQLNIEADYKTQFLVETLKKNKEAHIKEYAEAYAKYLEMRRTKAQNLKAEVEKIIDDPKVIGNVFGLHSELAGLTVPVDASKMYDEYIALLSASTSETIRMDVSDANAIINDQWEWARAASFANSTYTKGF